MLNFKSALAGALALALSSHAVPAVDRGQWSNVHPEVREWFKSLKNSNGISCCDTADGVRIEDPDWKENVDGSYEVYARGGWQHIDQKHVIQGTNKVGYAVLFWPSFFKNPICFVPGSGG